MFTRSLADIFKYDEPTILRNKQSADNDNAQDEGISSEVDAMMLPSPDAEISRAVLLISRSLADSGSFLRLVRI
jgi:hypothetical protein